MQSTSGSAVTNQPTADRELLADAPGEDNEHLASFTRLFQRKGAASRWEKFTHTLLMPLRRFWARQQVGKVLAEAERLGLDGLAAVQSLKHEFDARKGIHESTAQTAAIEMMINGVIPDPSWSPALNDYLDSMQTWYANALVRGSPHLTDGSGKGDSQPLQGLKILIDFARHPGCAVSVAESKCVQAFMRLLQSDDYDKTVHPGPPYDSVLSELFERYTAALENAHLTVEKSRQKLATPTLQRTTENVESDAFTQLRKLPEFVNRSELVAAFTAFIAAKDRPTHPDEFNRREKQILHQFLGSFAIAFQRHPNELGGLLHWVIVLEDALLDRQDLKKIIDLHPDKQEYKLLNGLETQRVSPACLLALAEYLLVSRTTASQSKQPSSSAHASRLNPESWMRLRYFIDRRDEWLRSLPLGKSVESTAQAVLNQLSRDIAAFERAVVRPHLSKKSHSSDNDAM